MLGVSLPHNGTIPSLQTTVRL